MELNTDIWQAREMAISLLAQELRSERDLFGDGFAALDTLIERYNGRLNSVQHLEICGLILVKGRNLCHCCLSLVLDGHGQEAGAILRPLIECFELLEYFHQDPTRINEALTKQTLPKAGDVARAIDGTFHALRRYLNSNTSHLSLEIESVRHLIDSSNGKLKSAQFVDAISLRRNLEMVIAFQYFIGCAATNCLQVVDSQNVDDLGDVFDNLRKRSTELFRKKAAS